MIDPNGIAHIQLTVRDVARSRPFYYRLLHETFGMAIQYDIPGVVFYCIGGRTGIAVRSADPNHPDPGFDQWRVGLHHFCFRLRAEADIDALHAVLVEMNATIVRAPEKGPWAPGYYSVLFEDPDGIRIEAVHVPGAGNLPAASQGPLTPPGPG